MSDDTWTGLVVLVLVIGLIGGVWFMLEKLTEPLRPKQQITTTDTTLPLDKGYDSVMVGSFVFYHFEGLNITCVHKVFAGQDITCFKDYDNLTKGGF